VGLILAYLESAPLTSDSLNEAVAASQEFVRRTNGYPLATRILDLLQMYRVAGPYEKGWPDPHRIATAVDNLWRDKGF